MNQFIPAGLLISILQLGSFFLAYLLPRWEGWMIMNILRFTARCAVRIYYSAKEWIIRPHLDGSWIEGALPRSQTVSTVATFMTFPVCRCMLSCNFLLERQIMDFPTNSCYAVHSTAHLCFCMHVLNVAILLYGNIFIHSYLTLQFVPKIFILPHCCKLAEGDVIVVVHSCFLAAFLYCYMLISWSFSV